MFCTNALTLRIIIESNYNKYMYVICQNKKATRLWIALKSATVRVYYLTSFMPTFFVAFLATFLATFLAFLATFFLATFLAFLATFFAFFLTAMLFSLLPLGLSIRSSPTNRNKRKTTTSTKLFCNFVYFFYLYYRKNIPHFVK